MREPGMYLDDEPTTKRQNRYNAGVSFLPAIPERRQSIAYPMQETGDNAILDVSAALQAQNLNEQTTPIGRSIAFSLRMVLLIVLLGALAFGIFVAIMFGDGFGWALVVFSALAIGGYYYLNQLDYAHSPAGVEKDKIGAIKAVALDKQRGDRALRREIVRGYLHSIGGDDNA